MKFTEITGKKILDKNVKEVGKISQVLLDKTTFNIAQVYGSTGSPISKKYIAILPSNIIALGDYLQISDVKEDIDDNLLSSIPKRESYKILSEDLINKKVIDANGNESGKITNIELDFENNNIASLTVHVSSSFTKSNDYEITKEEIVGFGDYILINKVLSTEDESNSDEDIDESTDDNKVNINVE